ncbi:MAG: peptidase M19 [Deltaproteobacteria bacterium CG_4_8_14_3_um_filter_51_11]|nr:peptidase M19 [bacterium]NCP10017.1 peptidase M19 [bacterium]PIP48338.1 MAG: peptidase M19 [Deltaproteobacteria bacterium CG23_combo_of_CG06-09_8_20_14_all_51_20]PIX19898.1 MAG: peptidase M19 [Deltaproteobacteria bacterium CG_4_8_14_3_um_filter_51_11]PJB38403.1 MAG: peptidase M19 [Deltaproteobacteria bacterium CG_4_9_14_3_um_filter_51_14]
MTEELLILPCETLSNPEGFSAEPHEIKHDVAIVDGHVDLPYFTSRKGFTGPLSDLDNGPWTLAKAREAGIKIWGSALYCEDRFNGALSFNHFKDLLSHTRSLLGDISVLGKYKSLDEAETFLILENADCLADRSQYAAELASGGFLLAGLTHAGKNRLADGNAVRYSDGITPAGKDVVKALMANGIMLDVAHLHDRCFWELMRLHDGPVVSSHSGVREACDLPRNLSLAQAKEITERGGIIGITVNPEMLASSGPACLYDVYVHMDILVQRFGPLSVGIGSDFCGFDKPAKDLEDTGKLTNIGRLLLEKGYGEDAVSAIMAGNWLRVLGMILEEMP